VLLNNEIVLNVELVVHVHDVDLHVLPVHSALEELLLLLLTL